MNYGEIEGVGKVSRLIFGGVNPLLSKKRQAEGNALLDQVFEAGINTFDLARVYGMGEVEKSFGEWLKTRNRDEVIIETKCCHPNFVLRYDRVKKSFAKRDIEASLKALKTDHVDLLLLHRDDTKIPVEEIIGFMNSLIEEGKTRAIGVSNWEKERIEKANEYAREHSLKPFVVSSPQFSLAEEVGSSWIGHTVTLTKPCRADDRAYYRNNQLPVFAYSSLAGGLFSGKYQSATVKKEDLSPFIRRSHFTEGNVERLARAEQLAKEKGATVAQISLAWTMMQGMNVYDVVSFSKAERIEENCGACDVTLTESECKWLNLE